MSDTAHAVGIVGLIVIAGSLATVAAITGTTRTETTNSSVYTIPLATTGPAPAESVVDPYSVLAAVGETNVTILWSDDSALNCGGAEGGCFYPEHPDTIILSPTLWGDGLIYVTLHELAHVHQHRAGLPLDECAADAQAAAWGADPARLHYTPNC